jgi:predicted site-specific integrase-resolvase
VTAEVTEIASGLNDERPKLKKLLTNPKIGVCFKQQEQKHAARDRGNCDERDATFVR